TPFHSPVFPELDQPGASRDEDRAVQSRKAAGAAAALNKSDPIAAHSPPHILLEWRECAPLRQSAGRLEFAFGSAFDRPRSDQNGDCDQQRKRGQGTAMRPQKRRGQGRRLKQADLIEMPFHSGEPQVDISLSFSTRVIMEDEVKPARRDWLRLFAVVLRAAA